MEKPLISRKALAERWEVTVDSLKRYEKQGMLSPIKITSRMLRYRLSEVVARESGGGSGDCSKIFSSPQMVATA